MCARSEQSSQMQYGRHSILGLLRLSALSPAWKNEKAVRQMQSNDLVTDVSSGTSLNALQLTAFAGSMPRSPWTAYRQVAQGGGGVPLSCHDPSRRLHWTGPVHPCSSGTFTSNYLSQASLHSMRLCPLLESELTVCCPCSKMSALHRRVLILDVLPAVFVCIPPRLGGKV